MSAATRKFSISPEGRSGRPVLRARPAVSMYLGQAVLPTITDLQRRWSAVISMSGETRIIWSLVFLSSVLSLWSVFGGGAS